MNLDITSGCTIGSIYSVAVTKLSHGGIIKFYSETSVIRRTLISANVSTVVAGRSFRVSPIEPSLLSGWPIIVRIPRHIEIAPSATLVCNGHSVRVHILSSAGTTGTTVNVARSSYYVGDCNCQILSRWVNVFLRVIAYVSVEV